MSTQLTADHVKQSLTAHVEAKGIEVFCKYGPQIGWPEFERLLLDRAYVRYPCTVEFDAAPLLPGECAHPVQCGETPEQGFTLYVHPALAANRERAIYVALYQLVAVNYGAFASAHDAEAFGAAALGLTCDEYYAVLCDLADEIAGSGTSDPSAGCPLHQ